MSRRQAEYVVVGAGLSGLMCATSLHRIGHDVVLFEASDLVGGLCRGAHLGGQTLSYGLKLFPYSLELQRGLQLLESLLGRAVIAGTTSKPPVTFHKAGFQPFVGFGEDAPPFVDEISEYLKAEQIEVLSSPQDWIAWLQAELGDRLHFGNAVQKVEIGADDTRRLVFENGQHFGFTNLILAIPPERVPILLPEGLMATKAIQKLANSKTWTSLSLDLVHSHHVSDRTEAHLLMGTGESAHACVGGFREPTLIDQTPRQISQWLTFIAPEQGIDTEYIGQVFREMKRQIKRAYPQALEKLVSERILVAETSHAQVDLKLEQGRWTQSRHIWVTGRGLNGARNLSSVFVGVEKILSDFSILDSIRANSNSLSPNPEADTNEAEATLTPDLSQSPESAPLEA